MSSEPKVIRAEISLPAVSQVLSVTMSQNSQIVSVNFPTTDRILSVKSEETKVKEVQTPGQKGDKGEPFKFEDFTQEQLDSLRSSVVSTISRQSLSDSEVLELI